MQHFIDASWQADCSSALVGSDERPTRMSSDTSDSYRRASPDGTSASMSRRTRAAMAVESDSRRSRARPSGISAGIARDCGCRLPQTRVEALVEVLGIRPSSSACWSSARVRMPSRRTSRAASLVSTTPR